MGKSTLWLLEGNISQDSSWVDNPKKRKVYERDNSKDTPASAGPIAIFWEHEEDDKLTAPVLQQGPYVQPIFDGLLIDRLVGQLLTHIDATYADKDQREAQKKIVRRLVWDFHNDLVKTHQDQLRFLEAKK